MTIAENTSAYIGLLEVENTLEAIDQFYQPNILQYENSAEPKGGKSELRAAEEVNLSKVNQLRIEATNIVVDEKQMISWGQMNISFDLKKGGSMQLNEAFLLKWKEGLTIEPRFYYEKIEPVKVEFKTDL